MNLSNKLTVSRFFLALLMSGFLSFPQIPFGKTIALLLFGIASLTDYFDGKLARQKYGITVFGQLLDPLADKVLVCAAFISFVALQQIVPAWIVVIIISRDFLVTGLRLLAVKAGKVIPADFWGKQKTIWQIVVILIVLTGLAVREDYLPLFMSPESLETFLTRYYNRYFSYLTFWISVFVAIFTLGSGAVYFWKSKDWMMKDA